MNLAPIPANLYTELRIKYVRKESAADDSVPPNKEAFLLSFCRKRPSAWPGTFGGTHKVSGEGMSSER